MTGSVLTRNYTYKSSVVDPLSFDLDPDPFREIVDPDPKNIQTFCLTTTPNFNFFVIYCYLFMYIKQKDDFFLK